MMFCFKTILDNSLDEIELSADLKALRKQAVVNGLSEKQACRFAAGVALDELRGSTKKINLYPLFESWVLHGNKRWLSPLTEIFHLYDKLLKFNGPVQIIRPFIEVLTEVSDQGIDPASFIKFVVMKRLKDDFNWRQWEIKHIPSLKLILNLLLRLKTAAPFDREKLGDKHLSLSRDVVLVKYVGQPLALFPEAILSDELLTTAYRQAWSQLSLDHFFSIYFLKINLLPITYHFSGKFEISHLTALIQQMPEIESAFETYFPSHLFSLSAKAMEMNLYDRDFDKSLQQRKDRGFRNLHFFNEINSYLKIISALLRTRSGIYLSGFYARSLNKLKDPVIAQNLAQLIESLRDQGGKHIYLWHSRKLLSMEKVAQIEYLALIIENDGIDPDYPDVVNIFRDPAESFEFMNMTSLAQQLGLSEVLSNTSADSLVLAYVQKYPNSAEALMRWRDEVISGADRDWSLEMIKAYDQLEKGSAVHKLLLSWVIKGLAGHYKSDSFEKLNLDYGTVPKQAFPKLTHRFAQPVYEAGNLNAFQEQEVRNQLDLKPVQLLWQSVVSKETPALPQIKIELNKLSINLNQPITEAKNKLLGLQQNSDSAEPAQLQKVQRTIKALEFQKQILEQGISAFDSLKDQEKIILGLFFASQFSHGYGESFSQLMISLIIKHYQRHENLKNQIQFLNDDIAFDLMNFNQFQKIIMMIETVRHIFNHDDEIQKIISDQLTQILIPLIKAKQKEITVESCDISFQKLFQVNKLLSFRSKWQAIVEKSLEKLEKQNEYQISVSKTILDAYYGDMGAVCLSGYPQVIKKSHLYNLRLIDLKEKTIVGNAVMVLAKNRLRHPRIDKFLQVFGINPLESLLKGKSQSLQLHLYLQFRKVFENLAVHLKIPIVLSGGSKWGILSNRHDFLDLILAYEKGKGSTEVQNVLGVSVYYDDIYFSNGILLHTK